jgi:hypothetical protein
VAAAASERTPPTNLKPMSVKRSRRPVWLTLAILTGILMAAGYGIGVNNGIFPAIALVAAETQLPTATATWSATPTATATGTPTVMPTLTSTGTPTQTDTVSPTTTATPTETVTLTPSQTFTPSATPNMTGTLAAQLTGTVAACRFDYAIVEQSPADGQAGGFYTINSAYKREIVLLNTGSCAWEPNTSLAFIEGESFDAGPRIFIRERVDPAEEITVLFQGRLPSTGSIEPIWGRWRLRTPGQVNIGEPITISVMVYDPGR